MTKIDYAALIADASEKCECWAQTTPEGQYQGHYPSCPDCNGTGKVPRFPWAREECPEGAPLAHRREAYFGPTTGDDPCRGTGYLPLQGPELLVAVLEEWLSKEHRLLMHIDDGVCTIYGDAYGYMNDEVPLASATTWQEALLRAACVRWGLLKGGDQ